MKSNRKPFVILLIVLVSLLALWLSGSGAQNRKGYQVEAQIYGTPEYRTDTARAVDAYERLMDRHMDLTERNFLNVSTDMKNLAVTLDRINARLATLDQRLARIEKHLGIQPPPVVPTAPAAVTPGEVAPPRNRTPVPPSLPQQ